MQGKINTIVRRTETDGLHTYHIKSPKLSSISVAPTPDDGIATLNGKAVITDITYPLLPIEIEGNGSIQLEIEDHGASGVEERRFITIVNRGDGRG